VLIHAKPGTRRSWDFRAKEGFYIGPAMESYRCFKLVKSDAKSQVISDMVEFRHSYITVPLQSPEDKIIHGLQTVAGAISGAPPPTSISQLNYLCKSQLHIKPDLVHLPRPLLSSQELSPPRHSSNIASPQLNPPGQVWNSWDLLDSVSHLP
jgi:hypothetical protein